MAEYTGGETKRVILPYREGDEAKSVTLPYREEKTRPVEALAPVVHGRWMDNEDYMFCSCCGVQWYYFDNETKAFKYCPNCGAKMDGGRNSSETGTQ